MLTKIGKLFPARIVGLVALLGLQIAVGYAQRSDTPNRPVTFTPEIREQVKKVIPSIGLVLVRNPGEQKLRPRGSAVIVRKDGLVVTNFHVIAQDGGNTLFEDLFLSLPSEPGADATTAQRQYRLKPLLTNEGRDLALLRLLPAKPDDPPFALPFVEIGDSRSLELLDDVFILGFPEKGGTTITVNPGVMEGRDALEDWIKTDGRLLHGNSGGAAINSAGKLIGIPTRVVVDKDKEKTYGSVGYLRPAHLVAALISKYQEAEMNAAMQKSLPPAALPTLSNAPMKEPKAPVSITVQGSVKSVAGEPLSGVRVGLLLIGKEVTASNLVTWGGSNAEGKFVLEKPVAPGRYNLRARVVGYDTFSQDIEITATTAPLKIELKPSSKD